MQVIGVDLAWSAGAKVNETGVVALEADGSIGAAGWEDSVERTAAWVLRHAREDCLVMVDAPLVVLNEAKTQRLCEREVGQRYWHARVSANSTNRASPRLAGLVLRERLEAEGFRLDDGTAGPPRGGRVLSECYPYTTIVGAHELGYDGERPTYKRKPRSVPSAEWKKRRAWACDELIRRVAALTDADPRLVLTSHEATLALIEEPSPVTDRPYKHREDLLDAVLAAWTGALWVRWGEERCQVLGAGDPLLDEGGRRATIIAPARPGQRGF